ncbi:MAG: ABC transporter permease, partial [Gemmatimonadaceae bacterium]
PGRGRLRAALVAAQVALALVMLAGAGLLARSLDRLVHVPLGYRAEHLTVLTLTRPVTPKAFQQQMTRLYDRSAPGIRAAPGVVSVTPVAAAPFYGPQVFVTRWASDRQTDAEARQNPTMPWDVAGPDYFRTFETPILRGRAFTDGDVEGAPRVVVVSRLVAERFWPGEDPVGKRMRIVGDTSKDAWHTVVGLAGDIRYRLLRQTTPTVFVPYQQWFFQGVVAVRTRGPIAQSLPSIRASVRAAEPQASIARVEAIDGMIANQLALPRLSTLLLASFGGTALLLAVVGLYGVMGAAVRERARELGIRAALGATPGRLVARVLAQAGAIALAGSVVGIAGALLSARLLRALLYEVSPADPVAVLGAAVVLLLTALAAAFVQARRATRIDPVSVLRAE